MPLNVNGEIIPPAAVESEFQHLLRAYTERQPAAEVVKHRPAIQRQAHEQAIGRVLLRQEAERLELEPSAVETEEAVNGLKKNFGSDEAWQAHLARLKLTPESLRATIRQAKQVELLLEQVTAEVPAPTTAEVSAYFDAHPDDFIEPERVRVGHILAKAKAGNPDAQAQARARLNTVKSQLQQGVAFEVLAAQYSDCPSGKNNGGDLGLFPRGTLVPAFEAAAFNLKPGDVSDPVASPFGLHLILKKEHRPAGRLSLDQVKDDLRAALHNVRKNMEVQAFVKALRQKARIEEG